MIAMPIPCHCSGVMKEFHQNPVFSLTHDLLSSAPPQWRSIPMSYDAIVVGGGLGGSTMAAELVRDGYKVLALERETQFRDRVRGESMLPWGVAAARRLDLMDTLVAAGGNFTPWWITYMMGDPVEKRDLRKTTPQGDCALSIYHPAMQEALLKRAHAMGAEVKRGATVVRVDAAEGRNPVVAYQYGGELHTESARLVIGADGRDSQMRGWGRFTLERDPEFLTIAGVLVDGTHAPDDAVHLAFGPGCVMLIAPMGNRKARANFVYPSGSERRRLSGRQSFAAFVEACRTTLMPQEWLSGLECIGPLAEFAGFDRWVESPAKNGVVLVGDAAASTDPSWGGGLSLTLMDAEHLSAALRTQDDWQQAAAQYAVQHDEYFGALHRILAWMTELTWTPGPEGEARRQRVFPRMMSDPSGYPDTVGLGPLGPSDEKARRLVLGIELSADPGAASTAAGLTA
jgi:2-polyprenyl-6-methoxyphenol hydroxylase-like FAD-dependent oxidoreductase